MVLICILTRPDADGRGQRSRRSFGCLFSAPVPRQAHGETRSEISGIGVCLDTGAENNSACAVPFRGIRSSSSIFARRPNLFRSACVGVVRVHRRFLSRRFGGGLGESKNSLPKTHESVPVVQISQKSGPNSCLQFFFCAICAICGSSMLSSAEKH